MPCMNFRLMNNLVASNEVSFWKIFEYSPQAAGNLPIPFSPAVALAKAGLNYCGVLSLLFG